MSEPVGDYWTCQLLPFMGPRMFLAQMVAAKLESEFVYAEPRPAAVEGRLYSVVYRLPHTVAPRLMGKRVAIVDDAINAGSALRGTFHALVAAGAKPAVAGALIVLGDTVRPFLAANGLVLEELYAVHGAGVGGE